MKTPTISGTLALFSGVDITNGHIKGMIYRDATIQLTQSQIEINDGDFSHLPEFDFNRGLPRFEPELDDAPASEF